MSESRSLFGDCNEWRISGQRYKHLTRFSRFVLFEPAARLTLSTASIFVTEGLFIYISCYLQQIIKIGFPELEKKFLQRFRSFFIKCLLKH